MAKAKPEPSWLTSWLVPSTTCAQERWLSIGSRSSTKERSGRGVAEPEASLDTPGMNLHKALEHATCTASVNAKAPIGQETLSPSPVIGQPLSRLCCAALVAHGLRVLLLTRAWFSLDNVDALSLIFA